MGAVKRSANKMANLFFLARHVIGGIFQSFAMLRNANKMDFCRCFVIGEMAPILDHLPNLHIQIFDGIGRVNDASHL
jgi:hypothetical protein